MEIRLRDLGTAAVAAAGAGDGWVSAKNMSNVRRLNMHLISSPAGLFSGGQWASRVHDFQIKFILVTEDVLLCRVSTGCFLRMVESKTFSQRVGGAAGLGFMFNNRSESTDCDDPSWVPFGR